MATNAKFAEIAALAGDPARAGMLHALMDGRALTASELARSAGIAPQTASGHLAQMVAAGLLSAEKQGRHRYHRVATPAVAQMVESIMRVASGFEPARKAIVTGPRDAALRQARTCYDHLAGRLGVALTDALVARGYVELTGEAGVFDQKGVAFLDRLGMDVENLVSRRSGRSRQILCRPCLDWSERRPHLAGAVGMALCRISFEKGWVRRIEGTRAVTITPKGRTVYREEFEADLD